MTLYALADSPVGLAAYFLDHDQRSYRLISRVFAGQAAGLTRDDILDNVTLTWFTDTALSSARLYWENKVDQGGHFAAWEQPRIFSGEVRAGFRPLRA